MADKRPGGLTALAVLNFVFGGLGAIASLGLLALLGAAEQVASEMDKAAAAEGFAPGSIYLALLLGLAASGLLIASGVGYLQQKRFLGRTLGNAYAIMSLGSSAVELTLLNQGFGVGTLIGLIYPVLTLALLNTTFKDDLVN